MKLSVYEISIVKKQRKKRNKKCLHFCKVCNLNGESQRPYKKYT